MQERFNLLLTALFTFFMYFWITFLSASQSWMVHEVIQGKDTTLASGFKRSFKNILDILALAFTMLVIYLLASRLREKGKLGQVTAGFLTTISGIAGKLVLPAMIVTERNFIQAVKQLKESIRAIPEIATFEIGIRPLTTLSFIVGVVLTIIVLVSLGPTIGIIFGVIWLIGLILLNVFVNTTYYTVLYLTLIEKKKVKGLTLP